MEKSEYFPDLLFFVIFFKELNNTLPNFTINLKQSTQVHAMMA